MDKIEQYEVQIQFELANRHLIVFPFVTMSHCVACASLDMLCKAGWPGTHRDPLVSVSQALGLKVCSTVLLCDSVPGERRVMCTLTLDREPSQAKVRIPVKSILVSQ